MRSLAANCLAFIKLASIRLWLRVDESTSQDAWVLLAGAGLFPGRQDSLEHLVAGNALFEGDQGAAAVLEQQWQAEP